MNLYFKDQDITQPISVVFNGGSFTTYTNVNPNYVLYDINPVTYVSKKLHISLYIMKNLKLYFNILFSQKNVIKFSFYYPACRRL